MTERPLPYIHRGAGDIIRADDWNEMQVQGREALGAHDHSKEGAQIPRAGLQDRAVDGSKIDPASRVGVQELSVTGGLRAQSLETTSLRAQSLELSGAARAGSLEISGELKVASRSLLAEVDAIQNSLKLQVNRNGDSLSGSFSLTGRLGIDLKQPGNALLQLGELSCLDNGAANNPWTNLGWNLYFNGRWQRLASNRAGVNLHMSAEDGNGQEFRFLRTESNGGSQRNIAVIGSNTSFFLEANVGIGTNTPAARLDVRGPIHAGGSDLYFTDTTHHHTGFGNTKGYAAIENDGGNYDALMILGRATGGELGRVVKIWDNVFIAGNLGTHGYSPKPKTNGWGGGIHTWDIEAEATIWARNAVQTGNRDLAENFYTSETLEAGDVVSLDPHSDGVIRCRKQGDPLVLGVVSTLPGMLLGAEEACRLTREGEYPIALSGRVPCKVTTENGPIRKGDLLIPASLPGHAMRADTPQPGTSIGKALQDLQGEQGLIDVFVFMR